MKTPTKIRLLILGSTLCVSQVAFAYTPPAEFQIHQIPLSTNDIAFSALSKHLLVTVPSSPGLGVGNSITHIDPRSGKILTSVFVGSEPGPIGLSSDGGTAYIGMGGAPLVRRYNVGTIDGRRAVAAGKRPELWFPLRRGYRCEACRSEYIRRLSLPERG